MKTLTAALAKAAIQLAVAIALLSIVTAGAYTGHMSSTLAIGVIGTLIGLVGLVSVSILNSPQPNSDLLPHLIFTLAVLASLTILLFHNIITSELMMTMLSPVLGGVAVFAGSNATVNAIQSLTPPPTSPTTAPAPLPIPQIQPGDVPPAAGTVAAGAPFSAP